MQNVQLLPLAGGQTIVLDKLVTLVGRKEGCDLRLNHRSVSKQHCVLVRSDGMIMLRDLGSTNGTRVNGRRVRRAVLNENDQLSVAALSFRVLFRPGASKAAVPMEGATQAFDIREFEKLKEASHAGPVEEPPAPEPVVRINLHPDEFTPVADQNGDGGD
ncbi:MAG TPA: FHA domain-containing protein [Gemmatales bacterium]|nr:FHA domain-containing protein [Gemmatales bacterium]HMP58450.1 FHA domain-containing protein [Gemmatales bacterium]